MPKGQYAKSHKRKKSLRDIADRIPHFSESVECPVSGKTFDKFPTIELLDERMQGEIDFYCPYCDTLVFREFRSPDRQCFEVVDPDHKSRAK